MIVSVKSMKQYAMIAAPFSHGDIEKSNQILSIINKVRTTMLEMRHGELENLNVLWAFEMSILPGLITVGIGNETDEWNAHVMNMDCKKFKLTDGWTGHTVDIDGKKSKLAVELYNLFDKLYDLMGVNKEDTSVKIKFVYATNGKCVAAKLSSKIDQGDKYVPGLQTTELFEL